MEKLKACFLAAIWSISIYSNNGIIFEENKIGRR